tara:strand:+ start:319 stop:537 length:219 start_codon:yes stop_codon:yes gene_type:complete
MKPDLKIQPIILVYSYVFDAKPQGKDTHIAGIYGAVVFSIPSLRMNNSHIVVILDASCDSLIKLNPVEKIFS